MSHPDLPIDKKTIRLSPAFLRQTAELGSSLSTVRRLLPAPPAELSSEMALSPAALKSEASRLHVSIDEMSMQLERYDGCIIDGGSSARVREMFDKMDENKNGKLELIELKRATVLPVDGAVAARLQEMFSAADHDHDGALDFDDFQKFLSCMRTESIEPLREARIKAEERLLVLTLVLTARSLSQALREIAAAPLNAQARSAGARGGFFRAQPRADEGSAGGGSGGGSSGGGAGVASSGRLSDISACVDTWCDIEERVRVRSTLLEPRVKQQEKALEGLLDEVGALACQLSLTNVTREPLSYYRARRSLGLLGASMQSSLGFCMRGLRIMGGDINLAARLINKRMRGRKLRTKDVKQLTRTLVDLIALVPYTIVMVVPLSPPGHVFAFSVLNRCFPGAVPSAFTRRRQEIDVIYSRIAADVLADPESVLFIETPAEVTYEQDDGAEAATA